MRVFRRWLALSIAVVATLSLSSPSIADSQDSRPLEGLAREVTARTYTVSSDPSISFIERRRATLSIALKEVIAKRGSPLLRDGSVEDGHIRLIYPDALVVVTGRYSSSIICLIEVPVAKLKEGFDSAVVISLAARSCRAVEERGWGAAGLVQLTPIGTEALPSVAAAKVAIYATDEPLYLFPELVREFEIVAHTSASLIRGIDRDDGYERPGSTQWRYAWFVNGSILALRYKVGKRDGLSASVEFACTVETPASAVDSLEGKFSAWCDRQEERLRPGLSGFIRATSEYRIKQPQKTEAPSPYGGFHLGAFPPALVRSYWLTGVADKVPSP